MMQATFLEMEIGQTQDRMVSLQHAQRFADAMAPNPKEWAYYKELETWAGGVNTQSYLSP